MARAIDACRRDARGRAIDAALAGFGLHTEGDLLARVRRLRSAPAPRATDLAGVARIFVLSRVTLGADVAVTSVGLRRLAARFPDARLVLCGGEKLVHLFGGDPRVELARLDYARRGSLIDRLTGWLDALASFEREGISARDLLVDPDTRVGQLGLLPLVRHEDRYHFFEGVADGPDDRRSLGMHFGEWIDARFGGDRADRALPFVALRESDRARAEAIYAASGLNGRRVVAVSLGVGGNARKRAGGAFEAALIDGFLAAGWAVVLDQGGDDAERSVADDAVARARAAGRRAAAFAEPSGAAPSPGSDDRPDLVTWNGGVGPFAALIERAAAYVGYDSLFQHVAAALGVPVATVFLGYDYAAFPLRWRPNGPGTVRVFSFGPGETPPDGLAARVARAADEDSGPGEAG
jgi:ADP-heptose:LPS heptosyltransferase